MEYTIIQDPNGRTKAENVTGPMGAYVQGAPMRRPYDGNRGPGGRGGGGFRSGNGDGGSYGSHY